MLKGISTYIHVLERLHPGILERLASGGAQGFEIFAMRSHFDYGSAAQVRELAGWFASNPVELFSLHAPLIASGDWGRMDTPPLNIAGRDRRERIEAMDEIKRALEVAEVMPFRFLIVHVGVEGEEWSEQKFEGALSSIEHLRAFATPLGVRLALENIPNELSSAERLLELIRTLRYDDLGVCLDLGHAHLQSGVEATTELLLPLVRTVHAHDNHGLRDEHLWPGEGTIDWARTMELLHRAPQAPRIVLEINGDPEGNPENGKIIPGKMRAAWEKLGLQ
jgi:sugar phosphate isomerase/epimerase